MAPLERYYKLPKEKRNRLVRAARSEFAQHGFERASVNRIIEEAEISKGAMYYYFADKADLFSEVIQHLLEALIEQVGPLRTPRDAEDFWAALWDWLMRTTAAIMTEPDFGAIGRCLYHDNGAQTAIVRLRDQVHGVVASSLVLGQSLGAVRDDVPTDMLAAGVTPMLFGLDHWFADRFEQLGAAEMERLSAKTLELCRDLLEPKPRRESPRRDDTEGSAS